MTKRIPFKVGAIALATATVLASCAREEAKTTTSGKTDSAAFINPDTDCKKGYEPTQGITGDTIKIGTVRPESGPYAIYGGVTKGLEAYVTSVNSKGGIKAGDGKTYKLELVKADDQYDPSKTPAAVSRLIEQDKVFALVGDIGTATTLSVRDRLNDGCIPAIALGTGSTEWGKANRYPWLIGGLTSYATEIHNLAEFLKKEKPSAKIALLYQNDDFGKAYQSTLKKEIEGTQMSIAQEVSYDVSETTTEAKVAQLATSAADVFVVGVGGTACPTALKNVPQTWKPMTFVSITCSGGVSMALAGAGSEGVYASQYALDPANPEDQKNPRMQEFMTDGKAAGLSEGDITGGIMATGWGFGAIFEAALKNAKEVTRAGVMNSVFSLDLKDIGLIRDGVRIASNGAEDPWLIENLRMVKRADGQWTEVAPMGDYNGKSQSFVAS